MAHGHTKLDEADKEPIGAKLWPMFRLLGAAAIVGLVLLVIGVLFESMQDDGDWAGRFFFAYLIGYTFVLGLTVGSVALVILTHLFRAGRRGATRAGNLRGELLVRRRAGATDPRRRHDAQRAAVPVERFARIGE